MSVPLRVMIVEDSRVTRLLLRSLIEADDRLTAIADVATGEEALRALAGAAPDIITMDVCLPGMSGFEATRRIMAERPTPIVVIAASGRAGELDLGLEALRAGAVHVIEKPIGGAAGDYHAIGRRICDRLIDMSGIKLVRNRRSIPSAAAQAPALATPRARPGQYRIAAIVASTGGPKALVELLNGLGPHFPLPVALVQHIDASFVEGFASWLGGVTPFETAFVEHPLRPRPGVVYMAGADMHLKGGPSTLYAERAEPVCLQRPSGTVLFESLAESLGAAALGVLLTGMGEDGARGLLDLRRRGAFTIAEDASTAVVYGMPRAAVELGAVCESLPLPAIAVRLRALASGAKEVTDVR